MARKRHSNAKPKRNAKPSLVGDVTDYVFPTGLMERAAKGARGDFNRLTGGLMNHRRNPDELAADSLASRLALAAVVPGGMVALTALEIADAVDAGLIDQTAGVLLQPMDEVLEVENGGKEKVERAGRREERKRIARIRATQKEETRKWYKGLTSWPERRSVMTPPQFSSRRNPEDSSALAYEIFHGKPPAGYTEVIEEIHEHEHLWVLGSLEKLVINTPSGFKATWDFIGSDKPLLCGNEPAPGSTGLFNTNMVCTQLYIRGGDQTLTLDKCKMGEGTDWWKEEMVIGELEEVTYHTQKGFDKFKPVDYYHALGEEGGEMPIVIYDTRNHLLSIAGGQYEIKAEGITN